MIHKFGIGFGWNAPILFEPGLQFVFLQRAAHGLITDRFHFTDLHEAVSEQSHAPSGSPLRLRPTTQRNQMRFMHAIEHALFWPLWLGTTREGILKPVFQKAPPHPPNGGLSCTKCIHDLLITPTLLTFE